MSVAHPVPLDAHRRCNKRVPGSIGRQCQQFLLALLSSFNTLTRSDGLVTPPSNGWISSPMEPQLQNLPTTCSRRLEMLRPALESSRKNKLKPLGDNLLLSLFPTEARLAINRDPKVVKYSYQRICTGALQYMCCIRFVLGIHSYMA